jgi:mono/diheme cytochrome c family protein
MRTLGLFLAGALTLAVVIGGAGFIVIKTRANGFSARTQPTAFESMAAQTARAMALPANAREKTNPVPNSKGVLADAKAHWADHCALCHGNDGSGQIPMGQRMYPPAPDMRKDRTQRLTDGELFYIIENGIRLTGMPAWGGSEAGELDSWKLVHFIRHLPVLSATEITEMEKLNPKSPEELEEEKQEEQFLNGQPVNEAPQKSHRH